MGGWAGPPGPKLPTASQLDTFVQEIALRPLLVAGSGLWMIDQLVPAGVSMSVDHCGPVKASPTATQLVGVEHDTPDSCVDFESAGFALVTWVHTVPFQCASSEYPPEAKEDAKLPTAKQLFALGHDTLDNVLKSAPGLGLFTIDHVAPFQRSMSVKVFVPSPEPPATLSSPPTAKQLVAVAHDTLDRKSSLRMYGGCSARLGLGTIDHLAPFQRSTRVWTGGGVHSGAVVGHDDPLLKLPTAKQFIVLVHEMLARLLESAPWLGLTTIDHVAPFQRSMSVLAKDLVDEPPTATQNVVLEHDTPDSVLAVAPGAFGLGTTVQPDPVGCSTSVAVVPVAVSR